MRPRGAELAMLSAIYFPSRIDAVIALGPNNTIEPGCCTEEAMSGPAWTANGKPFPIARGAFPDDMGEAPQEGVPPTYRPFFLSKTLNPEDSGAPIEVERMEAPLLLVAGGADRMWPAKEAATLIERRLKSNNYPHEIIVSIYPGAGHAAGTAEPFSGLIDYFQSEAGGSNPLGGTTAANARATYNAFPAQVAFLRAHTRDSDR